LKKSYKKGDVVWADLGMPPNEIKGHEQAKIRPCIVIAVFNAVKLALIVPCTTQKPPQSIYTTVALSESFSKDSFALCHQLRTISFERILNKKGQLSPKDLAKVQSVLTDIVSS
jgi:mRNA interferase MazF